MSSKSPSMGNVLQSIEQQMKAKFPSEFSKPPFNTGASQESIDFLVAHTDIPSLPADVIEYLLTADGQDMSALPDLSGLPEEVLEQLENARVNGQDVCFMPAGLISGFTLLPVSEIKREFDSNQEGVQDVSQNSGSVPVGYTNGSTMDADNWITLASDGSGSGIAIDLAPGPKGTHGQVVYWGPSNPAHGSGNQVLAKSWREFLQLYNELLSGVDGGDQDAMNNILDKRIPESFNSSAQIASSSS